MYLRNSHCSDNDPSNKHDLTIQANASFPMSFVAYDDSGPNSGSRADIANWSLTGSIKASYSDTEPTELFTVNAYPSSSTIVLSLTGEQTYGLNARSTWVYDVIANDASTNPKTTYRLMYGNISVYRGVTEPGV